MSMKMLLLYVVLVMMLPTSATAEGCKEVGPAFSWSNWYRTATTQCSLLCGGEGYEEQLRVRSRCAGGVGNPRYDIQYRNGTCVTSPCGDLCPPGVYRFLPHSWNQGLFYQCANEKAYLHRCPPNTVWGQNLRRCAWPWEV
ncbi:uncharacterized protein LOC121369673 [Gigantopelta aegis]|uniref:uncharacterized protein LOC121369673 n=1 Tax=Gigantopelta aegis TaxID=1735272 RepID=UPI001B88D6A2|nr:uncharacterized protein LOC121369673 [Gigantopelta aegis]